jgi:hypothetical protein
MTGRSKELLDVTQQTESIKEAVHVPSFSPLETWSMVEAHDRGAQALG